MVHPSASNLYILTGAPGSGKTAILARLKDELWCVDEPAREVLAEQRASGGNGTWDENPSLFVEPWSDIYTNDEERIMSFDETLSFSESLRDIYIRSGYTPVDVPRGSVDDRAAFVRELIRVAPTVI